MERRILGRSNIAVTPLGFGSQTIGGLGYGDQDWDQSEVTMLAYLKAGGRFIDSARGYGTSEIYVGKALKKARMEKDVVVSSKSGSLHPPCTRADMEVSRFCLQRDVIDIYYIHVPPRDMDQLKRVIDAYAQFKAEGKIRLIGLSQLGLGTQEEVDWGWKYLEDPRIDVMQFPYSFMRLAAAPIMAEAKKRGIGVVVRQGLEGGMFTDKFLPGHLFTDRANDWRAGVEPDAMQQALQQIDRIRKQFIKPPYKSMAQLALSWVLGDPNVTATIPGAGNPTELADNMSASEVPPMPQAMRADLEKAAQGLKDLLRKPRQ